MVAYRVIARGADSGAHEYECGNLDEFFVAIMKAKMGDRKIVDIHVVNEASTDRIAKQLRGKVAGPHVNYVENFVDAARAVDLAAAELLMEIEEAGIIFNGGKSENTVKSIDYK